MGNQSTTIVLSRGFHKKFRAWLHRERLVCFRCGEELHPGDQIHRCGQVKVVDHRDPQKRYVGNVNCRLYHARCFESLFLEV